jgi:hypothetical protein
MTFILPKAAIKLVTLSTLFLPGAGGKRLLILFSNARLCVFAGADHDLGQTHVEAISVEVRQHLTAAL